MASEQDVIIQINDITNRVSTTITTMAGDTRSVADKLAALQGAITSGNQAAVSAAMDNIAPELGKMSAMADQLDTIKTALHTLASDPNNPTAVGVPLSALGSGGDVEAAPPASAAPTEPASGSSSGGAGADTGTPPAQGSAAGDAAPAPASGSDAPPDTGAPAAPDLTGPTNTAVGGAADVPTTQAAGMPSGEVPAADPAPGTTSGPTVGAPDTAPGAGA
jgi:hypothetical protein